MEFLALVDKPENVYEKFNNLNFIVRKAEKDRENFKWVINGVLKLQRIFRVIRF